MLVNRVFRTPVREIKPKEAVSTPRRSSRIRQKSGGQSDSAQSDASDTETSSQKKTATRKTAKKAVTLAPVDEEKEIIFSPPKRKLNILNPPQETRKPSIESLNFSYVLIKLISTRPSILQMLHRLFIYKLHIQTAQRKTNEKAIGH